MTDPNHTNQTRQNGAAQGSSRPSEPEQEARGSSEQHSHEQRCLDFCPICRAADVLRASAPPELLEQWQTVQREALLTTRAMIEHYLARLDDEPPPEPPSRVEDIPIF